MKVHSKCSDKSSACITAEEKIKAMTPEEQLALSARLITQMTELIEKQGLTTEGIYKKMGSTNQVTKVLLHLQKGDPTPLQKAGPLVVSTALKQYLREMSDPLIDLETYRRLNQLRGPFFWQLKERNSLQTRHP
jgi:hypothetical protein